MSKFQKTITLIIAFAPVFITGVVYTAVNPMLALACMLWAVGIVSSAMAYILLGGQQTPDTHVYHQYRVSAQPAREAPVSLVKEATDERYELSMVGYPRD